MSTISHTTHTESTDPRRTGVDTDVGQYLTDGVHLYRIAETVGDADVSMIGLEDCRTLEVVLVASEEFPRLHLRDVVPV